MATRKLQNLVRCNIHASGLQIEKEDEGRPSEISNVLRHEWLGVKPATCPTEKQGLSNKTTALVSEAGSARNRTAGSFSGHAAALSCHRDRSAGVCRRRPLEPKRSRTLCPRQRDSHPWKSHNARPSTETNTCIIRPPCQKCEASVRNSKKEAVKPRCGQHLNHGLLKRNPRNEIVCNTHTVGPKCMPQATSKITCQAFVRNARGSAGDDRPKR